MTQNPPKRISTAVLISGTGRTLKHFIELREENSLHADIPLVISSNPKALGLQHAKEAGIRTATVSRNDYATDNQFSEKIFTLCREEKIDYVAMAGFLKLLPIPPDFENRVLNIHPSLIPAFCGKGLYGMRVHQALLDYGAKIAGCTVHFVDNQYDHGPIFLQETTPVFPGDTPQTLADRVFETEKKIYPRAINLLASGQVCVEGRQVKIAAHPNRVTPE